MNLNLAQAAGEIGGFTAMAWAWSVEFLPRFGGAVLLFVIGLVVASWIARVIRLAIDRSRHIDSTIGPIAATAARYAILIVFLVAVLGQLGVQTTSLLAVLGAAGLAIGLALQGTLANVAAGIMLIYLRPFRVGDTIETPTLVRKVQQIGLFASYLETPDGLFYFVPNSALWNVPLKNQTRNPRRMAMVQASVSYRSELSEARRILLALAASDERVATDPPPTVTVESTTDTRIIIALRAWTSTAAFGDVQRHLAEEANTQLRAAGIKMP